MNQEDLVRDLFVTNDVETFIACGGIIHSGVRVREDSSIQVPICESLGNEKVYTPYVITDLHVNVTCQKCLEWLHA